MKEKEMKLYRVTVFLYFLLAGCGGGGYSGGNASGTVPAAPTGVTVNSGTTSGSVVINWAPVAGASSYNIYYDTTPNISIVTSTEVPGINSPPPYTLSHLQSGITYYLVVTADNDVGQSSFSNEVSIKVH